MAGRTEQNIDINLLAFLAIQTAMFICCCFFNFQIIPCLICMGQNKKKNKIILGNNILTGELALAPEHIISPLESAVNPAMINCLNNALQRYNSFPGVFE